MELKNINFMEINCGGCGKVVYLSRDTHECPYCCEEFDLAEVKVLFDAYEKVAINHNKKIEKLPKPAPPLMSFLILFLIVVLVILGGLSEFPG